MTKEKKELKFILLLFVVLLFSVFTNVGIINAFAYVNNPIADGIYYIKNKQTQTFMQVDDNDASNNYSTSGAFMELWALSVDGGHKQWRFTYLNNGYYSIVSVQSGLALAVKSGNENEDGKALIQEKYTGDYRQQWNLETLSDGYVLRARSSDSYRPPNDWCMCAGSQFLGITDGLNVEQRKRSDDDDYKDVWYILSNTPPTSGGELAYDPDSWNGIDVKATANCYSYAFNAHVNPTTGTLQFMQPGQASGHVLTSSEITAAKIISLVKSDSQLLGFTFKSVERDAKCSLGTYKVALVIAPYQDYHWYRQDTDGFWSHKPGATAVRRTDNSKKNLIIDPQTADRGVYSVFAGYFEVTPINTNSVLSYSSTVDCAESCAIDYNESNEVLPDAARIETIERGMTYNEVTQLIGKPQRCITYGLVVVEYDLNDGSALQVEYSYIPEKGYTVESYNIVQKL